MKIKISLLNVSLFAIRSAVVAIALSGFAAPVMATTITFESLAQPGNSFTTVSSPYIEAGFQFAAHLGFAVFQTGSPNFPGSTALLDDSGGTGFVTTLTQVGGGDFSIQSLDLMGTITHSPAQTLTFIGTLPNNSTVTQTFNVPASGSPITENLFFFTNPGFLDVKSVTFAEQVFPFYQFDNVTVNAIPAAVSDSGSTILLMLGSIATLLVLQRVLIWRSKIVP